LPAALLQTEAVVLVKRPPSESFQGCALFSVEHGVLLAFVRLPKKRPPRFTLDLFDTAAFELESSNQGRTWFVREAHVLERAQAIGRSYEALQAASAVAGLIARNPPADESRPKAAALLRSAFAALASGAPPAVVLLKSVYRHARDEGYPVKEEWLAGLPAAEKAEADRLLRTPLSRLDSQVDAVAAGRIRRRLEEYVRGNTEILLD